MAEFELRHNEFCRSHGLALSALQCQLKSIAWEGEAKEVSLLMAVELAGKSRDENSRPACALQVVLCAGRSVKVRLLLLSGLLAIIGCALSVASYAGQTRSS
jgi:hypothetical protein